MSNYLLCRNAFLSNNYSVESARKLAKRLTARKGDWVEHFNNHIGYITK